MTHNFDQQYIGEKAMGQMERLRAPESKVNMGAAEFLVERNLLRRVLHGLIIDNLVGREDLVERIEEAARSHTRIPLNEQVGWGPEQDQQAATNVTKKLRQSILEGEI